MLYDTFSCTGFTYKSYIKQIERKNLVLKSMHYVILGDKVSTTL
jgi:hypothetical protein